MGDSDYHDEEDASVYDALRGGRIVSEGKEKTIAFCWPPRKCGECPNTEKCLLYEYYQNLASKN